jgi:tryptophan-rich sensory protein
MLLFAACILLSTLCVAHGMRWYVRPTDAPPWWVFVVVWTALYVSLAYSLRRSPHRRMHHIHLLFGLLWCYVFFVMRRICFAILPCLLVLGTAIALVALHRPVRWYLLPLVGWCAFAVWLNVDACKAARIEAVVSRTVR